MRSRFQSFVGLLLTAVLLAWSGVRTAGLVTRCEGDSHGPCQAGVIHTHAATAALPADGEALTSAASGQDFFQAPGCGCPPGHVHLDAYPPLIGAAGWTMHPLILVPFSAYPVSHAEWESPPLTAAAPIAWEAVPPGPPPMHLSDAPMLI